MRYINIKVKTEYLHFLPDSRGICLDFRASFAIYCWFVCTAICHNWSYLFWMISFLGVYCWCHLSMGYFEPWWAGTLSCYLSFKVVVQTNRTGEQTHRWTTVPSIAASLFLLSSAGPPIWVCSFTRRPRSFWIRCCSSFRSDRYCYYRLDSTSCRRYWPHLLSSPFQNAPWLRQIVNPSQRSPFQTFTSSGSSIPSPDRKTLHLEQYLRLFVPCWEPPSPQHPNSRRSPDRFGRPYFLADYYCYNS